MLVATCPSREELLDFAVGKLSDADADALAGHLDSCENCQAELAALSDADDTLVARLRGPLPPDPFLDEPECSRAVAIARAVGDCPDFCLSKNGTVPFDAPSTTNLPRLLGEYQLLERLGSGGMGTVYKALHTKLGRVVALKVLTRARTHDPSAVARFEREMQAIGQLDHRHIVRAHDAREIDGTPILVMEYLDGLDLGEIVRRVGALDPKDACELARQTAVGLQTIHEHGLVHRDIKPSNLMLSADGEVKILDLGLARLRPDMPPGEEMTATGQGMGTADYMAPEQASDSRAVDIRADIYSLGCTLYKLLTGRAPFSGPDYCTAFDKMTAHVHAAPPPVRSLAPAVPEGLTAIVNRMLAKNPADRFATPADAADALLPYCAGADLAALLKRAASSPPIPPGDAGSRSRLPSGTNSGRPENKNLPSPSGKAVGGEGRRWNRFFGLLVLLLMAGGLGFALAIILRIHKDGKDTTVTLPDGSSAQIGDNGQVDVTLPGTTKSAKTNNTPESQIKIFTLANGDAQKLCNMLATIFPEQAAGGTTSHVPLRFSVDTRTNQLIASGTMSDLAVVEAILSKFDVQSPRTTSAGEAAPPASSAKPKSQGNEPNPFMRGSGEVHAAAPLPTVRVTQPVVCEVCDYEEYTGRIDRKLDVVIRLPVTGMPVCRFRRGLTVKKGDLLAEIVSKDDWARLHEKGQALNRLALNITGRGGRGAQARDTSPSSADAEEQWKSALAEWNRARGDTKTVKILAPCSGETSAASASLVFRGGGGGEDRAEREVGTPIGRIAASDSMVVTFDIDERAVLAHRRMPNRKPNWELSLPVVFGLADDKGFPYRGEITSVAADIDPNTHSQRWQAVVPNNGGIFMPGMSVRLRLFTSQPHKVMLVPNSASIHFIWPFKEDRADAEIDIVNNRDVIESRKVSVGRNHNYDDFVAIQDGLNANDWVVIRDPRIGIYGRLNAGETVKPEKTMTQPPPWAAISVPPSVSVAHPVVREVSEYADYRGITAAAQRADICSRATGSLIKVYVKPGMSVKQGEPLFEIDPKLYQAQLDQAAGTMKQAQIRFKSRVVEVDRAQNLQKTAAISQGEFDKVKAERDEAEAAVQTAEAALNVARLRLESTKIVAPFAGTVSDLRLGVGDIVTADTTVLASLSSVDPMSVEFLMPQPLLAALRSKGGGKSDWLHSLSVHCALPDGKGFVYRATMDSVESRVEAGGNIVCRALLPNKDGVFMPGMQVTVRVTTGDPHKALCVPMKAIASDQTKDPYGHGRPYVLVVTDQNVAERRDVQTGPLREDGVWVTGVTADDWVITSGAATEAGHDGHAGEDRDGGGKDRAGSGVVAHTVIATTAPAAVERMFDNYKHGRKHCVPAGPVPVERMFGR